MGETVEMQPMLDIGGLDQRPAAPFPHGDLGEVFTRRWVVELILDLAGYTVDQDLAGRVAVEPSCGEGAFLGVMIDRLLQSAAHHHHDFADLTPALRAFDLSESNIDVARKLATERLTRSGADLGQAQALAEHWVSCRDFLLMEPTEGLADFVIGNPPYIRLENIPPGLTEAYRRAWPTMCGRSDVYVGFIERGLRMLRDKGTLAVIVADRWMHNQYGAELRRLIGTEYSVKTVIEMHDVSAFEHEVSAYPAITVIRRERQGPAVLARAHRYFRAEQAEELCAWSTRGATDTTRQSAYTAARLPSWFPGDELWPSGDPAALAVVRELERRCLPLQDPRTGTRIGIGVATGADSVYLTDDPDLVEADRLLPLVMARDTVSGVVRSSGIHMVNPWVDGRLISLDDYPRLRSYFEANAAVVRARHVSQGRRAGWYRTIDRVEPGLQNRPKLLLPELKAYIHPVLEEGSLYPHHNLYFVTSDRWDLEVLGGLLLSDVANLFVGTYCVKMRGGCYRFQAQYLRKIRVPDADSLKAADRRLLARAFEARDVKAATAVALRLYGLDQLPQGGARGARASA